MPRLTRLRFVNIGHPYARMEDLTLNLCNEANHPVDSTLWLRNAGGKSSLLSLFFSLINPNRYQFLGAKVATGERSLDDYVLPEDRSVVIAEWQLDTDPNDAPIWYLTGGLYEWRGETIERLFFAARVCKPNLTFENLPLKHENGRRLTIHGFKQAWQNLGKLYPQAEAQEIENQQGWRHILEQVRIDPELFNYQIRMNSHEGGADELFRFRDTDHFVDFFLSMVMPTERSKQISGNLEKFRGRLRERQVHLLPGLALIEKLKPQMDAMIVIASQRLEHQKIVGGLQKILKHLQAHVEEYFLATSERNEQISKLQQIASTTLEKARQKETFEQIRMLSLQQFRLELRAKRFASEQENLQEQLSKAKHECLLWEAARLLARVERHEEEIRKLQDLLQIQNAQLAPDWNEVRMAANSYAAALLARANENRQLARRKIKDKKMHGVRANAARQAVKEAWINAAHAEAQAQEIARQIKQARVSRAKLEESKTLEPNEFVQMASLRWQEKSSQVKHEEISLAAELENTEKQLNSLEIQLSLEKDRRSNAWHDLQNIQKMLKSAIDKRDALLNDAVLSMVLEEVNVTALNRISLDRIKNERSEVETKLRNLKAAVVEHESVVEYLRLNSLLPPVRDVQAILKILAASGVTAWAGWEHVSEHFSKREEARAFIREYPEIVQGILVKDDHFHDAQATLAKAHFHLRAAILVGMKSFASNSSGNSSESKTEKIFIIGPTSDAHFDKNVGKDEEQALDLQLEQERAECEEIEQWSLQLRDIAESLEQFISLHPQEWFVECKTELLCVEARLNECESQIIAFEQQRDEKRQQIEIFRRKGKALLTSKLTVEEHIRKLQAHQDYYGTDEHLLELEKQKIISETLSVTLLNDAEEKEKIAVAEEKLELQADDEARRLELDAQHKENEARATEHIDKNISPQVGDIPSLKDNYQRLRKLIEQKTDGNHFYLELEQARQRLSELREQFNNDFGERIAESEVRRALSNIADKSILRTKFERSQNRVFDLTESVGMAKSETQTAQKELAQHRNQHTQIEPVTIPEEKNLNEEELEQKAQSARAAMKHAQTDIAKREQEIVQLKEQYSLLQIERQRCESWQKRIISGFDNEELFQDSIEPEQSFPLTKLTEGEVETYLESTEKEIRSARQQQIKLSADRQRIYRKISDLLSNVDFAFARELKAWDEENLEREAQILARKFETREKNMREELEDCNKHRNLLIDELITVADRGVQMLRSLANNSKLPISAGTLAKQPFLKIKFQKPDLPSEQHQRIENLLDDIVREGQTPEGVKLMQRAVRKLAAPIKVDVLFPDIDAPPRHIQITEMSKESGGERLTSAVLLYCALAQQRARERGLNFNISSSLLLDNPVGAASRAKFLELQRETARAMNIQLIYATGVNDFEAIRTMPNVVRLRNEKHNDKNQRLLEAVRNMRPEDWLNDLLN
jgi:hypothetical protein